LGQSQSPIRIARAGQLPLMMPPAVANLGTAEPEGVVYTKRWVVELLLDLAGYTAGANLVDVVAVEPSAGEGAFLVPMIERLADSCHRLGRLISDCRHSLVAYELDEGSADRARKLAVEVLTKHGVNAVSIWPRLGLGCRSRLSFRRAGCYARVPWAHDLQCTH
jgi:adenine-specific DNA-methyltransferase